MQATEPTLIPTTKAAGDIHWKLTGSSPCSFIPKIGPENAISTAVVMLQVTPIQTPAAFANGTKSAKKNKMNIGTVSRFTVFWVTAEMLPGTFSTIVLHAITTTPIPTARPRAYRMCFLSEAGFG